MADHIVQHGAAGDFLGAVDHLAEPNGVFFALLCVEVRAGRVASDVFVQEAVEEHLAVVVVA